MKKVLLLLFTFLLFAQGFGQTYHRFLENTSWLFRHYTFGQTSSFWLYSSTDTLISGYSYTPITNVLGDVSCYVREDTFAKRVYVKDDLSYPEHLVYNFALTPGSIFQDYNLYFFLDSIDSVSTYLGNRRRFNYHLMYNPFATIKVAAIEGIGSTGRGGPFQFFNNLGDGFSALMCTYVGTFPYYQSSPDSCLPNVYLLVKQAETQSAIRISPNPATTYLTIQLKKSPSSPMVFQLYDITGRVILQKPLTAQTNTVELSGVSKGMYLYSVTGEKERVGAGKLIIE